MSVNHMTDMTSQLSHKCQKEKSKPSENSLNREIGHEKILSVGWISRNNMRPWDPTTFKANSPLEKLLLPLLLAVELSTAVAWHQVELSEIWVLAQLLHNTSRLFDTYWIKRIKLDSCAAQFSGETAGQESVPCDRVFIMRIQLKREVSPQSGMIQMLPPLPTSCWCVDGVVSGQIFEDF